MAITTNTTKKSDKGANLSDLVSYINHIIGICYGIANKLDADGGVTDTNYTALISGVITSGAILNLDGFTLSTEAQRVSNP